MTGSLDEIIEGYLDLRFQLDPVWGTAAGRAGCDDRYGSFEPAAVRAHIAALRSYTGALEEASTDSLEDEIDRTATLHDARHQLLVLERVRPFARDPSFHVRHALDGLRLLAVRPPARAPAAAMLARLQALPAFVDSALQALREPAQPMVEAARALLAGGITFVRDELVAGAEAASADAEAWGGARQGAVDALVRFSDALALMSEDAEPTFAVGREVFDRLLHTAHMIRDGADALLRFAEREAAESLARVEQAAAAIDPAASWRDVMARLRADVPVMDERLAAYAGAVEAERAASARLLRGMAAGPAVVATPAALEAIAPPAAYHAAGAFEDASSAALYVTMHERPRGAESRGEIAVTAAREASLGRHQQMSAAHRATRVVRRVLASPASADGWAAYAEDALAEHGGLESTAARFFHAHLSYRRALSVIIDVSLHTKAMPMSTAGERLRDALGLDAASAASEVVRACAHPTELTCAAVGARDLRRLRDDARRARAADFALDAFHDEVLRYGALPIALARWGMGLA